MAGGEPMLGLVFIILVGATFGAWIIWVLDRDLDDPDPPRH